MEDGKRALVAGCVSLACQILAECSSSEDEEIADEEALLCAVALQKYRTKAVRIENYSEVTVPRLSDKEFRENFRLSRSTFVKVAESLLVLDRFQADNGHGGYQAVVPEKQLQIALWTLGTQESFREVADRFDVSRSTCHAVLRRVVRALALDLAPKIICWPFGERQEAVEEGFRAKSRGFYGIVGAVDGCHIPIKAPLEDPVSYVNRKSFHSVLLQGICDHELLFTDIDVGWPGSVHDARVYRTSPIAQKLQNTLPPDKHLVGDNAHRLKMHLMIPYKGAVNDGQQRYNNRLSMARQCIERCFALLKCRWRRLKHVDASDMELLVETIMACCVLHNLCLLSSDGADDMLSDEDNQEWPVAGEDGAINNEERAAKTKRNNIQAHLLGLP